MHIPAKQLIANYFTNVRSRCVTQCFPCCVTLPCSTLPVSHCDILNKDVSQLTMYAGNESIVQILRSGEYKVKFPIYASMINSNLRKGERRKELLEQGHEIFRSFFNNFPQLPHVCIEEIFRYLSDQDLRILIVVCKPVKCQQS
jgi:hypothetical protein